MHPSTLTLVLQEKRPLPQKNLKYILEHLEMSPTEESIFSESLSKKRSKLDQIEISNQYMNRFILEESNYKVLAEWEHYAVITLMETEGFSSTEEHISKRLNIEISRVKVVLKNLEIAKLISISQEGELKILKGPLRTTEDISSKALRVSHKETLDMSKNKLDEVEVELRDFSSMTIAVDPKKIPDAKAIIREFRKKMASLLRDGDKTEVYQMAIQLYPLTGPNKGSEI